MLFIFVFFLGTAALTTAVAFVLTRRRLNGEWRREGPKPIADALERRNRTFAIVSACFLAVLAIFEVIVPSIAFGMQDLQADALGETLPLWAVVRVGDGSISWLFYLAILLGIVAGLTFGTLRSLREHDHLGGVGVLDVM